MDPTTTYEMGMIEDGSARWLWCVWHGRHLKAAGIAMSATDAEKAAVEAQDKVDAQLFGTVKGRDPYGWNTTHLNLDELERIDKEEREGRAGK